MKTAMLNLSRLAFTLAATSLMIGCAPEAGPDLDEATAQTAQADTAETSTVDADPASQTFDPKSVESFEEMEKVDPAEVLSNDSSMSAEQQGEVATSACARYTLGTRMGSLSYSQSVTWCWSGGRVTTAYRSSRTGTTGGAQLWKFVGHTDAQESHGPDWADYYTQGEFSWCLPWACTDHQPEVEQWVDGCGGYGGTAQFN